MIPGASAGDVVGSPQRELADHVRGTLTRDLIATQEAFRQRYHRD